MVGEASLTRTHFEGATILKVQISFDIHLFEGQIDVNDLDKWMNLLEGYYFTKKKIDTENLTFTLLKSLPHVKNWWEVY